MQLDIIQPVDKDLNKTKGFNLLLPVEYECLFTPAEKFSFGFKAGLENNLTVAKNSTTKTDTTKYTLTPSFKAGFQYDTLKKFILNAGVELALPVFSIENTDNSDTKVETTTYRWDKKEDILGNFVGYVTFTSGFKFEPVKNLIFDCNWAMLTNVFGTDTTSAIKGADIWATVNNIIVHEITIQLSYKF